MNLSFIFKILECLRKYVSKNLLAFRTKSKLPSHQDFGVFALEVKKIQQATPSKLRREMGMCATTIYVQQKQYYTIRVLVVRTPVSSLSFQVQHTWYLVRYMQAPNRPYKSEVRGSVSRVKTPCEQGLPHCTYVLQAEQRLPHATEEKAKRSFPMERGPTAKRHPAWNPQRTQWFGQRSFRSSALHRKSCHASVPVMLENAVAAVAQMDRYEPYLARCGAR